nr:hypothetical protein [Ardenticatena sp.]
MTITQLVAAGLLLGLGLWVLYRGQGLLDVLLERYGGTRYHTYLHLLITWLAVVLLGLGCRLALLMMRG